MIDVIYKLEVTAKYGYTHSYVISTDVYYLPSVKACLEGVEAFMHTGANVTIVDIEIKRIKVIDNATI